MKVTGIIRRFDDFGRIAIPKEIRRQLFGTPEKSECMPMEIFMDKDNIILRKYEEDDVCMEILLYLFVYDVLYKQFP